MYITQKLQKIIENSSIKLKLKSNSEIINREKLFKNKREKDEELAQAMENVIIPRFKSQSSKLYINPAALESCFQNDLVKIKQRISKSK